jgi:hypothetical protein
MNASSKKQADSNEQQEQVKKLVKILAQQTPPDKMLPALKGFCSFCGAQVHISASKCKAEACQKAYNNRIRRVIHRKKNPVRVGTQKSKDEVQYELHRRR